MSAFQAYLMFWFVLEKRSFQLMNPRAMNLSDWNKVQGKYVSPNSLLIGHQQFISG
jgi:hypothetical protein